MEKMYTSFINNQVLNYPLFMGYFHGELYDRSWEPLMTFE